MLKAIDKLFIGTKLKLDRFMNELREDESGVSNIVATVILILIVVLLAALFWDKLKEYFNQLWERITSTADGIQ